jgi:hypothetical protein
MHINLIENEIPQVLLILGHFLKLRHIRRVPFFVSCQIDIHLLARWVMQQILYLAVHNPIHIAQIDFFLHQCKAATFAETLPTHPFKAVVVSVHVQWNLRNLLLGEGSLCFKLLVHGLYDLEE